MVSPIKREEIIMKYLECKKNKICPRCKNKLENKNKKVHCNDCLKKLNLKWKKYQNLKNI